MIEFSYDEVEETLTSPLEALVEVPEQLEYQAFEGEY